MRELEINRVRELRKNPNRSKYIAKEFARTLTPDLTPVSGKALIYRLLAVTGTITGGYLVFSTEDALAVGNCRTGINVTRAPQGVEALLIGKDPRTGREIVRLNYPQEGRLKEGTPVESTSGSYELEVTLSAATGSRRYLAPCGQAVNIPIESVPAQPIIKPTEPPKQPRERFPWEIAALSALAGAGIGGSLFGIALSANERRTRRAAAIETEQARNERDQTLGQLLTHEDAVVDLQNRETQLTGALTQAGVPVPAP